MTWLFLAVLIAWIIGGAETWLGSRKIEFLRDVPPEPDPEPRVSVVVAARNEERSIRAAVVSMLELGDALLEVVVVNDRSTDGTQRVLRDLLENLPDAGKRLRIIDLDVLPEGWLGKANALQHGAADAAGEWVLFTDADVQFESGSLARALRYVGQHRLDHLAATPELRMPDFWTDLFGGTFVLLFSRYARPWRARTPNRDSYIGIGAFNLVRKQVYDQIGGHSSIRLRTDDDMMLGRAIKRAGCRQDVVYGTDLVTVEWYPTLSAAVRGLEKNAFAGLNYSILRVAAACAAILLFVTGPWLGLVLLPSVAGWLSAGSVGIMAALYVASTRGSGANPRYFLLLPLAALIIVGSVIRATWIAVSTGVIRWRETSYTLEELRRHHR